MTQAHSGFIAQEDVDMAGNKLKDDSGDLTLEDTAGGPYTLAELVGGDYSSHASRHQNGGSDEVSVAGLSGDLADLQDPKDHTHQSGGGGVGGKLDHGLALDGLGDDDHTQYIKDSEFVAKGDILGGTGSGTFQRAAVGVDGQLLKADSGATPGISWTTEKDFSDILIIFNMAGETYADPGTSYSEGDTSNRFDIPFDQKDWDYARLTGRAAGNEAGSGKGVEIYNSTTSAQICEATWDGSAETVITGSWTSISITQDSRITVRFKGSSANEDITIYTLHLQLRR